MHFETYTKHLAEATRLAAKHRDIMALVEEGISLQKPPIEMEVVFAFFRKNCEKPFQEATVGFQPLAKLTSELYGSRSKEAASGFIVTCHQIWALNNTLDAGSRVYQVSPGLSQRLLLTELRGLRCGDLRLPYRALYVEIDPALGFVIPNRDTGDHALSGAYIVQDDSRWLVFLCGEKNQSSTDQFDDAVLFFWLDLKDADLPVGQAMKNTFDSPLNDIESSSSYEAVEPAYRWLLNLLFYITRPGYDDLEHVELNEEAKALWRRMQNAPAGKKRERLRERWRAAAKCPRIYVGRSVPLVEGLPKRRSEVTLPTNVKTLVAGHFMRYHVGPGRAETVWKFREPHWRGLGEEAEPTTHYVR